MVRRYLIRSAVVALTLMMAAFPLSSVAAQESQIQAVADAWPRLLDGGDVDGLLSLFTDDLVFAHPRYPAVVGKDSMRAFATQIFRQQSSGGSSIQVERIQTSGNWAHVVASFETTWTPTNGANPFRESARYLWVLRRDATGAWRVKSFSFYPIT